MSTLQEEISRRRTFAIISHPDAGKTTLTEKFLLYGGAIAQAGAVKGKKNARAAVSDWMEIEKQRGISVTSSVMQFQYEGFCINILDTPGHQDFLGGYLPHAHGGGLRRYGHRRQPRASRRRRASCSRSAPCAISRSLRLSTRWTARPSDPFDLLDELENELGIETYAVNWPIGCGKEFQGVYDRRGQQHRLLLRRVRQAPRRPRGGPARRPAASAELIGADRRQQLRDDVELLGAGREFDMDEVRRGRLSRRCSSARR